MSLNNRPRTFLLFFFGTLFMMGSAIEFGSRIQFAFSLKAHTGFATIDSPLNDDEVGHGVVGPYRPNQILTLRQFAPNHSINRTIVFKTNNLGWVSSHDYLPKKPGEFRVAILGDSLTASITNEKSWVDVVQETLSRSGSANITVLNLGVVASGFAQTATYELPIARRMGADLVVLNFSFGTFNLPNLSAESKKNALRIGKMEIPVQCSLLNTECHLSLTLRTEPGYIPSVNDLVIARKTIAEKSRLLRFLSSQGSVFFAQKYDMVQMTEAEAIKQIRTISNGSLKFMLITNPLFWPEPLLDQFVMRVSGAGFDIVDMRKKMPVVAEDERKSWYNLPTDGHWSDKGAEIYGHLVANVIRERMN